MENLKKKKNERKKKNELNWITIILQNRIPIMHYN